MIKLVPEDEEVQRISSAIRSKSSKKSRFTEVGVREDSDSYAYSCSYDIVYRMVSRYFSSEFLTWDKFLHEGLETHFARSRTKCDNF